MEPRGRLLVGRAPRRRAGRGRRRGGVRRSALHAPVGGTLADRRPAPASSTTTAATVCAATGPRRHGTVARGGDDHRGPRGGGVATWVGATAVRPASPRRGSLGAVARGSRPSRPGPGDRSAAGGRGDPVDARGGRRYVARLPRPCGGTLALAAADVQRQIRAVPRPIGPAFGLTPTILDSACIRAGRPSTLALWRAARVAVHRPEPTMAERRARQPRVAAPRSRTARGSRRRRRRPGGSVSARRPAPGASHVLVNLGSRCCRPSSSRRSCPRPCGVPAPRRSCSWRRPWRCSRRPGHGAAAAGAPPTCGAGSTALIMAVLGKTYPLGLDDPEACVRRPHRAATSGHRGSAVLAGRGALPRRAARPPPVAPPLDDAADHVADPQPRVVPVEWGRSEYISSRAAPRARQPPRSGPVAARRGTVAGTRRGS